MGCPSMSVVLLLVLNGCLGALPSYAELHHDAAGTSANLKEGSGKAPVYNQSFSTVPWTSLPGGRYKESSTHNFPASTTTSGMLTELAPGSMREQHWHDPPEWAYVIKGSCGATVVEQGSSRAVDSWVFNQGDVWYFPTNLGHIIIGLPGQDNCTYLSAYNQGDFRESVHSRGVSGWLTSVPADILAQGVGVSVEDVQDALPNALNNFIAAGDPDVLTPLATGPAPLAAAGQASLQPPNATPDTHRIPLYTGVVSQVSTSGGNITLANNQNLKVSQKISGAIVHADQGSLRQLHWHPLQSEWQYVINGSMRVGVYDGAGKVYEYEVGPGDVGFVPRGAGHWIKATGDTDLWVILIFDDGQFSDVEATNWLGATPPQFSATALGTNLTFTQGWQYDRNGIVAEDHGTTDVSGQ